MTCTACLLAITTWMELRGQPYCRTCYPKARANWELEDAGYVLVKRVIRRSA